MRKRTPPENATVLWEIFAARIWPEMTARPVQRACPIEAPTVIPMGFLCDARAMVVIWLRSPHSARKVSTNASRNMGVQNRLKNLRRALFGTAPTSVPCSFSSTSSNSASIFSLGSARIPMYIKRMPKKVYKIEASLAVVFFVISLGTTNPSPVDRIVIITSALRAPLKTMLFGCRIDIIAAIRKVSSPISDTMIIDMLERNASVRLRSRTML
mmetsp:Transcript_7517/g.8681  ORF Transcript_7517/g.8681 Transcript_7517/m.8681 type:complete len:213 (+) Transcript_7517:1021-1659(+)